MGRLKILFIALMVLALALSIGPNVVKAYDDDETGNVESALIEPTAIEASGQCRFKTTVFVAGSGGTTTSETFVPIPNASITFRTRKRSSCLRITFSAEAFTFGDGQVMIIEARVDGSSANVVPSGILQLVARDGSTFAEYHTAVFFVQDVPKGNHTVEMFFRRFGTGTSISVNEFSLCVDFSR